MASSTSSSFLVLIFLLSVSVNLICGSAHAPMSRAELIADHANKVVPELLGKTSTTILFAVMALFVFFCQFNRDGAQSHPGRAEASLTKAEISSAEGVEIGKVSAEIEGRGGEF